MSPARRRWVRLLATAAFVVGCSSPSATPSPSATESASPQVSAPSGALTSYGQLFAQVQPDGSVSKATALQAFATVIAPLPGVAPVDGPPPEPYEQASGTFAIDWIMRYYAQLTPAQQAVVDSVRTPTPDALKVPVASTGNVVLAAFHADVTKQDQLYLDALTYAHGEIHKKLNRDISLDVLLMTNTAEVQVNGKPANAYTDLSTDGKYCLIHVNPSLTASDVTYQKAAMAHEMFHCSRSRR